MKGAPRLLLLALTFAVFPHFASAAQENFESCLADLQHQARQAGVDEKFVNVVSTLELQQRVLELDQKQPEFVQTFAQYLKTRVSNDRVAQGRAMYRKLHPFLTELTAKYGVPGQYLIAFWGLETNFGSYLGRMKTLDSLATLACDPRRSDYFSSEFVTALRVMERESLSPDAMRGSWAGAMGHTQFMPTTYLRYAVDGNGDGKINLWQSEMDALASGANFLMHLGWQTGLRWGREVRLPDGFDYSLAGGKEKTLASWAGLGLRSAQNAPIPQSDIPARLIVPAGHEGPAFLAYDNFDVIMKWNRSEFYALSVGLLADRIAGAGDLYRKPPEQSPLSRKDVILMQSILNKLGYDAGEADGVFGPSTRSALSLYEKEKGMISDGFPDTQIFSLLKADAENL